MNPLTVVRLMNTMTVVRLMNTMTVVRLMNTMTVVRLMHMMTVVRSMIKPTVHIYQDPNISVFPKRHKDAIDKRQKHDKSTQKALRKDAQRAQGTLSAKPHKESQSKGSFVDVIRRRPKLERFLC